MRRFKYVVLGLAMAFSVSASSVSIGSLVNAEQISSSVTTDYDDDVIEEEELIKYFDVTSDTIVKSYFEGNEELLNYLLGLYNDKFPDKTTTVDKLTKGMLDDLINNYYNDLIINDTSIKSIKGLGLIKNAEKINSIDISSLTSVTEIPDKEFEDGNIIEFKMPSSIKTIGEKAFSGCSKLTKVNFPDNLTVLKDQAFQNCDKLTEFNENNTLPDSLITVGRYVFQNDISLASVTIPSFGKDKGNNIEKSTGIFYGCKGLETIKINEGITVIPASAFEKAGTGNNKGGVVVDFPSTLTTIKAAAFANVLFRDDSKTLDLSSIENSCKIESEAFKEVQNIETVILPDVKNLSFGDYAFAKIVTEKEEKNEKTNKMDKIVESALKSMYVKGSAHEDEIYIPDSVDSIGAGCFYGNVNIKKLSLSPNLDKIPDYAFDTCTELSTIEQRQDDKGGCNITSIGDAAFRETAIADTYFLMNMNKLTDIGSQFIESGYTIDKGVVKTLEYGIKNNNDTVERYYSNDTSSENNIASIPVGGIVGTDLKFDKVVKEVDGKTVTKYIKKYKNYLCGSEVFSYCPNLKTVTIPASVKTIAPRAFYNSVADNHKKYKDDKVFINSAIETIIWESDQNATKGDTRVIGSGAFQGNYKATSVVLPENDGENLEIDNFAFACDSAVTSFKFGEREKNDISNTVTKIGTGAFYHCESIDSVKVHNTADDKCPEIGSMAFWACKKLNTVILPAAITEIPDHIFYDDPVKNFYIDKKKEDKDVDFGNNITKVGDLAFFGNLFEKIDLSGCNCLEEIGAGAFAYYDMVIEEKFEGKNAKFNVSGNNKDGEPDHGGKATLKEVILPEEITTERGIMYINVGAFSGNLYFDTMKKYSKHEEDGEAYIPDYMVCKEGNEGNEGRALFAYTGVKKVLWEADETHINEWKYIPPIMYLGCTEIDNIKDVLPKGDYIEGLGEGLFFESKIKGEADLSSYINLKKLGTGNANLSGVSNPGVFDTCFYLETAILPTKEDGNIIVGKNCFKDSPSLYQVDLGSVKELQDMAFKNDIALESYVDNDKPFFPDTLITIGTSAFENCSGFDLTNVNNFSANLQKIGNSAFKSCTGLTQVAFKSKLTEIGGNAFEGCTKLKSVDFSNASELTKIGSSAFSKTGLEDFKLTDTKVKTVEGSLLKACTKLKTAEFGDSIINIQGDAIAGCPKFSSISVAPTTVVSRDIFKSVVDNMITAQDNSYSVGVMIRDKELEPILVGSDECDLPLYVNPKDTSDINNLLVIKESNDPNVDPKEDSEAGKAFKVSVNAKDGYYWGTSDDPAHKISSSDYYEKLEISKTSKYNNIDVDVIKIQPLLTGKYEMSVTFGMTFNCQSNDHPTINASKVTAKFKYNIIEPVIHPVIYSNYNKDKKEYDEAEMISTENDIVIQADRINKGSTKYFYNIINEGGDAKDITTYDVIVISDNPEVAEVSGSSDGAYPEKGYETTEATINNSGVISPNNEKMFFYVNPKKTGHANITVRVKGSEAGSNEVKMSIDVKADIKEIKLNVPDQFSDGVKIGDKFNVFSGYTNVFDEEVNANNKTEYMNVYSNNTISYTSNAETYAKVDENGNVEILQANKTDKNVRITAKAIDAKRPYNFTCDIKILGDPNGIDVNDEDDNGNGDSSDNQGTENGGSTDNQGTGNGGSTDNQGTENGGSTDNQGTGNGGSTGGQQTGNGGSTDNQGTGNGGSTDDQGSGNGGAAGGQQTGNGGSTGSQQTGNGGSTGGQPTGNGDTTSSQQNGNTNTDKKENANSTNNGTNNDSTVTQSDSNKDTNTIVANSDGSYSDNVSKVNFSVNQSSKEAVFNKSLATGNDTAVSIPATVTVDGTTYKVTSFKPDTFAGNTTVTKIDIGENITSIPEGAFNGCSALTTVNIPSAVTDIGNNAFKNCKSLNTITIPASLVTISDYAFSDCTELKQVIIPNNAQLRTIGKGAFQNCKSLTSITLTKFVKTIKTKAFYNCKKLKTINVKSTSLTKIGKNAFKGINKKAVIKVPKKCYKKYKKLFKGKGQSNSVKIKKA